MENRLQKLFIAILVIAAFSGTILFGGCGESEAGKALTDSVRKVIGEEVSKKTDEAKKSFDQFLNPGSGRGEKEGGQGSAEGSGESESQRNQDGEKD